MTGDVSKIEWRSWLDRSLTSANYWATEQQHAARHGSPLRLFCGFWLRFIYCYFLRGELRHGRTGMIVSILKGFEEFNRQALLFTASRRLSTVGEVDNIGSPEPQHSDEGERVSSLSVVMIIKNEARHLRACIESLAGIANEIVILDSGSTDNSLDIARQMGGRVFSSTDWKGFGRQRQIAQSYATGDYVLALDADERLTEALRAGIVAVMTRPLQSNSIFWVKRLDYFCGVALHARGWHRDRIARLYARKHFQYFDHQVHESLNCGEAKRVELDGLLLHHTNEDLYHFLRKNLKYADDWANARPQRRDRAFLLRAILAAKTAFFREYLIKGGFLGGMLGWVLAMATASYSFNKYLLSSEFSSGDP